MAFISLNNSVDDDRLLETASEAQLVGEYTTGLFGMGKRLSSFHLDENKKTLDLS